MDSGFIKLVLFGIVSGYLWFVSRASLRVVRSHGFYRFFAWEAITALILLNMSMWFSHPFSVFQIVSWILLSVSLYLLGNGIALIRAQGKSTAQRQDSSLYDFEKTTALVTSGIYQYIRHPLYGSLLFLAWGVFLKDVTWFSICLAVLATVFLTLTGKADEAECLQYFGASYKDYMVRTKMFIPYIF
jgi:protein-S-isoprenylcysteine O-methyltransferase Ste14